MGLAKDRKQNPKAQGNGSVASFKPLSMDARLLKLATQVRGQGSYVRTGVVKKALLAFEESGKRPERLNAEELFIFNQLIPHVRRPNPFKGETFERRSRV